MWLLAAVASSFFAGVTAILAKCGIRNTDSDVATAIRTIVVLIFSWLMVLVVGSFETISSIEGRSLLFLILSGLATGASWLCYFKALANGDVNKVVAIDKSSTVLTVILAMLFFNETSHWLVKLFNTFLIGIGVLLMVEKKQSIQQTKHKQWLFYAVLSAVFAALTSILAKMGIARVESNLATAIRTVVVLIMAWGIVIMKGKQHLVKEIQRRELFYICLSGIATGASWLCYYYAIQNGIVSIVVPIDKLSIVFSVIFSYFVFKERLSKKAMLGLGLMIIGTLSMVFFG